MPTFSYKTYKDDSWRNADAYVSGAQLSGHQKRALARLTPGEFNWYHDSALPPWRHFAWIISHHAIPAWVLYLAINAQNTNGHIWLTVLTVALATTTFPFWRHMYYNTVVRRLNNCDVIPDLDDDPRWYYLYDGGLHNARDKDFSSWLKKQLDKDAQHFESVHVIVDEYLRVTDHANRLIKSFGHGSPSNQMRDLIKSASDAAYEKLRPIYENAMQEEARRKHEEDARIASETAFCNGEAQRITAQRISMAAEDIGTYTQGNQALTST
jgi:hypothetical protein